MKYRHTDGTEWDVAELAQRLRDEAEVMQDTARPETAEELRAASALLARHERVCEALEKFAAIPIGDELPLNMDDVLHAWHVKSGSFELRQQDIAFARAALRGEEASGA